MAALERDWEITHRWTAQDTVAPRQGAAATMIGDG
jgi:hypothetical protein